mmetsp:Transcript_19306/g.68226  ORF Transcript_19306/g.68226 Transcript_19306/m.68226 type:complete len:218 (-) Transcript_19306:936-1589(-)
MKAKSCTMRSSSSSICASLMRSLPGLRMRSQKCAIISALLYLDRTSLLMKNSKASLSAVWNSVLFLNWSRTSARILSCSSSSACTNVGSDGDSFDDRAAAASRSSTIASPISWMWSFTMRATDTSPCSTREKREYMRARSACFSSRSSARQPDASCSSSSDSWRLSSSCSTTRSSGCSLSGSRKRCTRSASALSASSALMRYAGVESPASHAAARRP